MQRLATPEEAEKAFYQAFTQCDLSAMMKVWDDADDISCIHPQGPRLSGYGQILRSWRAILTRASTINIGVTVEQKHRDEGFSLHVVSEEISTPMDHQQTIVLASNGYRLTENGWRMVLHHASVNPATVLASDTPQNTRPLH